jgi:hypothetical protein
MKSKLLLASLVVLSIALVAAYSPHSTAFADTVNGTSTTTITTTATFDPGFLITMALMFGGIVTLGFVVAELVGMYVTKSAQSSIVQTTTTGINAIVSMTSLGVTASQAAAVTEVAGVPTQIVVPSATPATPAKTT